MKKIKIQWIACLYWFCEAFRRVTSIQYDVACFMDTDQIQIFLDHFSETNITEATINGEIVMVTTHKPFQGIKLHLNPNVVQEDIGTTGKIRKAANRQPVK